MISNKPEVQEFNQLEFVCGCDPRPLIPDGTYTAKCTGYEIGPSLGLGGKLYLNFEIDDPLTKHNGTSLDIAYSVPQDMKFRPGHKYYKDWVKVRGAAPSKRAEMSPKIFLHKMYVIRTRTVKTGWDKKRPPRGLWYSVVDCIEKVVK